MGCNFKKVSIFKPCLVDMLVFVYCAILSAANCVIYALAGSINFLVIQQFLFLCDFLNVLLLLTFDEIAQNTLASMAMWEIFPTSR